MNKKRIRIYLDDILFIESKKDYICIVTSEKSWLTKGQISEIEDQLNNSGFLRIHRSFIIALDKIKAFSAIAVEIQGHQIPIGRSYKELVFTALNKSK